MVQLAGPARWCCSLGGSALAFPRVENTHSSSEQQQLHRRTDALAMLWWVPWTLRQIPVQSRSICCLLSTLRRQRASRKGRERGRRKAAEAQVTSRLQSVRGRGGWQVLHRLPGRWWSEAAALEQGLGSPPAFSSFPLQTCCKTPNFKLFCRNPACLCWSSWCRTALACAKLHAACCSVSGSGACNPGCRRRWHTHGY